MKSTDTPQRQRALSVPSPRPSPKLTRLPARGRLLVSSDLHGNLRDFLRILARFERMDDDAHLLFLGDLVHGPYLPPASWPSTWNQTGTPPLRGRPYRDESPALISALALAQERHPGRVHALLGNHEHAHIGGPRTGLFARDEAGVLEQRLGVEASLWLAGYLRELPLLALAPCGVLLSHAAPAAEIAHPDELETIDYRRYLAGRPEPRFEPPHDLHGDPLDREGRFDLDPRARPVRLSRPGEAPARLLGQLLWESALPPHRAQGLLGTVGAQIAVYGHSVIDAGHQTIGTDQLILSTSFGMPDEYKRVLELDLGGAYQSTDDLRPGLEILPLYP